MSRSAGYAWTFLGQDDNSVKKLTEDDVTSRLVDNDGSLWDALAESFELVFDTQIGKAGFAKELLAYLAESEGSSRPAGSPSAGRQLCIPHPMPRRHDHLACAVVVHCPKPVTLVAAESRTQLARFLFARRGMLTSSVNEAVAFVHSDPALTAPDLELIWLPVPFLDEGLTPPPAHGLSLAVLLLQPQSRGHIRLATADPAEPPIIDPGYLTAGSDLRPLLAGIRIAERLCETDALRSYIGHPMAPWPGKVDDEDLARYVREHAQTAYHPVGSCRMGADDSAVVDCELRVHGLDGLRVVDASVIPQITRGHPHAPTVMIAERAAELIRASNHAQSPRR